MLTDHDINRIAKAVVKELTAQQKPDLRPALPGSFAYRLQQAQQDLETKGAIRVR